MAKHNMSELIRSILTDKPDATNADVFKLVKKKIPKVNAASCGVAASNQRRNLGLGKTRAKPKRRPAKNARRRGLGQPVLQDEHLDAAAELFKKCRGNRDLALRAIDRVESYQVVERV